MYKKILFFTFSAISSSLFAQVASHACQALKQSPSALIISDVESGNDDYDVNYYGLDLEASNLNTDITGTVISKSTANTDMDTMWFHLTDDMALSSVLINGNSYTSFIRSNHLVQIPLQSSINSGSAINMTVSYNGTVGGSGFFSAYSAAQNNYGQMVSWTLSEPFGAKSWFPVKEDLVDKIDSVSITITSPGGTFAASNGLLESSSALTNGKVKSIWKSNYLIDFYLIAFSIADYKEYSYNKLISGATDSILVQNFIYNTDFQGQPLVNVAEPHMNKLGDMLDIFSDKFGLYPFVDEKYGIMMAPLGGGMEHQTLSTQGYISNTGLNAHELGHQWWGDHVTCSTWNDIWLNEGFATYSEYVFLQENGQTASAANELVSNQNSARQSIDGTVFVPDGSGDGRIFSGVLTYAKGMTVVHMLRYVLGDNFYPFLKHYQTSNTFGNSTTEEFKTLLNAFTGADLSWFIDEWIYGKGYPAYDVRWKQGGDGVLWLDIDETPTSTDYFSMNLPFRLTFDDGTTEDIDFRPMLGQSNVFSSYSSTKTITDIDLDPENWVLKGNSTILETYPIGLNELSNQIEFLENPSATLSFSVFKGDPLNMSLTDVQGKVLLVDIVKSNSKNIYSETSEFNSGLYFINFNDNKGNTFVKKWIKK